MSKLGKIGIDAHFIVAADGADMFYELGVNGVLKGQLRRTNKDLASESFETWADIEGARLDATIFER